MNKEITLIGKNQLENFLKLNIGVFYKDKQWKDKVYSQILDYYTLDNVKTHYKSDEYGEIILKDNNRIIFVNANEQYHLCRFNIVVLEPNIDMKIFNRIIKPTFYPKNAIIYYDYLT